MIATKRELDQALMRALGTPESVASHIRSLEDEISDWRSEFEQTLECAKELKKEHLSLIKSYDSIKRAADECLKLADIFREESDIRLCSCGVSNRCALCRLKDIRAVISGEKEDR